MEQSSETKQKWEAPVLVVAEMSEVTRGGVFAGRPVCERFPDLNVCQS
ncbi:MAG: hypothetical protein AAGI13_03415 [Pseudomonadota bacterium]